MARLFEGRLPAAPAADLLSAAQVAWRARAPEEAMRLATHALSSCGENAERRDAHGLLARLAQSLRSPAKAAEHLRHAIAAGGSARQLAPLHLALAKLYEHRLRDPVQALSHALKGASAEADIDAARRTARLERRTGKRVQAASTLPLLERE
jgi:uncharacterized protein